MLCHPTPLSNAHLSTTPSPPKLPSFHKSRVPVCSNETIVQFGSIHTNHCIYCRLTCVVSGAMQVKSSTQKCAPNPTHTKPHSHHTHIPTPSQPQEYIHTPNLECSYTSTCMCTHTHTHTHTHTRTHTQTHFTTHLLTHTHTPLSTHTQLVNAHYREYHYAHYRTTKHFIHACITSTWPCDTPQSRNHTVSVPLDPVPWWHVSPLHTFQTTRRSDLHLCRRRGSPHRGCNSPEAFVCTHPHCPEQRNSKHNHSHEVCHEI